MIIIIAAMTKDRVIGKDNKLPWDIPEELELFKRLTKGNTVIMGRKTFESIGNPLPDRNNIIVSTTMQNSLEYEVAADVKHAILLGKTMGKDVYVIGGASIYKLAIPLADKMHLSFIKGEYDGDVKFPEWNEQEWEEEHREDHEAFTVVVYHRKDA